MTFEEWKTADDRTRRDFESYCRNELQQPWRIGELASQAAEALARKLTHLPEVNAVIAGEDHSAGRCVLVVTTAMRSRERLPGVPEEFAGFPIVQRGIVKKRGEYLRRLVLVLRAANLSEAEINKWSKHFGQELNNAGSVYYAEIPGRWIAVTLIDILVKDNLVGAPRVDLRGELTQLIEKFFVQTSSTYSGDTNRGAKQLNELIRNCFSKRGITI